MQKYAFFTEYYGFPETKIFFFSKFNFCPFQRGIALSGTVNNSRDIIFLKYLKSHLRIRTAEASLNPHTKIMSMHMLPSEICCNLLNNYSFQGKLFSNGLGGQYTPFFIRMFG